MGRLTMIRSVVLNLNAEYRWHNPIGANGVRAAPNRDHIWRDWSTTLFSESDDLCPWGGRNGLGFPALERLIIDFSEWQLAESEGLLVRGLIALIFIGFGLMSQVKPFLRKLGESGLCFSRLPLPKFLLLMYCKCKTCLASVGSIYKFLERVPPLQIQG